jgi:hypothetical protein
MSVARKLDPGAPQTTSPVPAGRGGHLRLVPSPPASPQSPAAERDARRLREARWVAVLLAVVTVVFFGLWTVAMQGAADAGWWPVALVAALAGVVALGIVVVRKSR